ncbi:hypothetical protein T440DRAFT_306160 [Plenodomus tracheiphilus IPT5]|uniref:RING-type domain-containing protein n=1 Tax=Plenodomus tracheiphilus IPT5 TaxID=1408161 RepID=A0A6A7BG34_9PLEO|nr:hypothetical protein T440DRAFT_306160 [Plenodomus tracheiphilus IPT5]
MSYPSERSRTEALAAFTTTLHPSTIPADADCPICLESLASTTGYTQAQALVASEDWAIRTRCGHTVHHACLLRWTDEATSCPYCRQNLFRVSVLRTRGEESAAAAAGAAGSAEKRRFAVPFEDGEFEISEALYLEWFAGCRSEEEFEEARGFKVA